MAPLHGFDPMMAPSFDRSLVRGSLALSYSVFDGGARGARIGRAEAGEAAAYHGQEAASMDLIAEVSELFDGPRFFHIGMDEETFQHQRMYHYVVVRQGASGLGLEAQRAAIDAFAVGFTGIGSVDEATDLALVLRSGSLPINLQVEEVRAIGPTLGQDSIDAGTSSVSKSSASVCRTSGSKPSSTCRHSSFDGWSMTATFLTFLGTDCVTAAAAAGSIIPRTRASSGPSRSRLGGSSGPAGAPSGRCLNRAIRPANPASGEAWPGR